MVYWMAATQHHPSFSGRYSSASRVFILEGTSHLLSRRLGVGGWGLSERGNAFDEKRVPDPKLKAFTIFGYPLRSAEKNSGPHFKHDNKIWQTLLTFQGPQCSTAKTKKKLRALNFLLNPPPPAPSDSNNDWSLIRTAARSTLTLQTV